MLRVWLPLDGNTKNYGVSDAVATNYGATVDTAGKIGDCYSFDGSDDFISINCSDLYQTFSGGEQPFSVAFWIYHADTTRGIIFGDYGLSGGIGFNVELTTNHQVRFYWNGTPDKTFNANSSVGINTWTHIVLVYDGNEICIYKNGVQQSDKYSGTLAAKSKTSGKFYLGRDNRTGATALNGKLNDFRIYDNALSAKEIAELAKGLVCHYTLSGFGGENLITNSYERIINPSASSNFNYVTVVTGLTVGETYTFSAVVELEGADYQKCTIYNYKSSESSDGRPSTSSFIADGVTRGSWTFTATNTALVCYAGQSGKTKGVKAIYKQLKLEHGSVATPWIPYSSDALYTAMGLDDNTEYDVSGYINNGEKHGSITYSSDTSRYVTSSVFDGTSYISANSLSDEVKTISLWVKTDWLTVSSGYKLLMYDKATKLCIGFYSNNRFCTYIGTSSDKGTAITYENLYNVNEWNHIVVVKTGAKTRDVYINGEKAPTTTNTYFAGTGSELLIGCRNYNGYGNYFDGQISDFRAYVTQLSEDDILNLYQVGASLANNGVLMAHEFIE